MRIKKVLSLSVPPDIREWIEKTAGERRLSISDYAVELITKGILAESIDKAVARLEDSMDRGSPKGIDVELLKMLLQQVLATRYIVERHATGGVKSPALLGTDANAYAERALSKYFPTKGAP